MFIRTVLGESCGFKNDKHNKIFHLQQFLTFPPDTTHGNRQRQGFPNCHSYQVNFVYLIWDYFHVITNKGISQDLMIAKTITI